MRPGTGSGPSQSGDPRVAVIIPCFNDGELLPQAVYSIDEPEPVEIVIVDDGSTERPTREACDRMEAEGYRVLRQRNQGLSAARMTGLAATSAPYVFPLDADDMVVPGALGHMADRLEADGEAAVCFGDYAEFRTRALVRGVPERLDPYRVAYTNEYPASSLFRRQAIEQGGGWRRLSESLDARSDWNLWLSIAEQGRTGIHLGSGRLSYVHRVHGGGLATAGRQHHGELYDALRASHGDLFRRIDDHRDRSDLSWLRSRLYPLVYGRRWRWSGETRAKGLLDRLGIWTLTRTMGEAENRQLQGAIAAGQRTVLKPTKPRQGVDPRVAVIIPSFNSGDLVLQAVRSIEEDEPIEIVVVDDGSTDSQTHDALSALGERGHRVVRHDENRGVSEARMSGLRATRAPYVFPLDSDDLAVPGALAQMADRLDALPEAAVCFGDYAEFRVEELVRAVPERLDPYRIAYTNEYPANSLFRRSALETIGGWRRQDIYEDWDLWMSLAELGPAGVHLGAGSIFYRHRLHSDRLTATGRRRHRQLYRQLRGRHPKLFERVREHRRNSDLGPLRKLLYPLVYGGRPRVRGEPVLKAALDRVGIWTLRR